MRMLFIAVLLALLLSFGLVAVMQNDPGYVLISYGSKTYEMSVWVALFLYAVVSLLLYMIVRVAVHLIAPRGKLNRWLSQRSERRHHDVSRQGLLAYIEGDWGTAQKLLSKSAKSGDYPLLSYLIAARASQELGEAETSYQLLRQAEQSSGSNSIAIGITQAQLQLATGQLEDCVATLLKLKKSAPKHGVILKMLVEVYQRLEDWHALLGLLPQLKKQKLFGDAQLLEMQRHCVEALLQQASNKGVEELERRWSQISSPLQKDTGIVAGYARCLLSNNAQHQAEKVLRLQIKREWDDNLVDLYGQAAAAQPDKQLLLAESWLKQRPNNATLLRSLGRITFRNGELEKSKGYYLASLDLQKTPATYIDLARLMAQIGEYKQSSDYYQQGMEISASANASLAIPKKSF